MESKVRSSRLQNKCRNGDDKNPIDEKNHSISMRTNNLSNQPNALVGGRTKGSVFHNLDFRAILILREVFRLFSIICTEKGEERDSQKDMFHKYCNENGIPGETTTRQVLKHLLELAKFGADKVHFIQGGVVPKSLLPEYPWLVSMDVSNGQEDKPILVTNICVDPPITPTGFTYITSMKVSPDVIVQPSTDGCQCKGNCINKRTCLCARRNGSRGFPYVDDRLIKPRDIIFECGATCGCRTNCGNKVSQKGLKFQLEVYRTPKKGWGVRTWDLIHAGEPISEYVGVLYRSDDLDDVTSNDYIFNIDCLQTINELDGRKKREPGVLYPPTDQLSIQKDETTENGSDEYCIEAGSFGNVSRFINHSCEPNLFIQCVQSPNLNIKQARIMLFAARDIKPYEELTYDYGYQLDSVCGPDGEIKQLPCYCGAPACRKRLY